MRKCKACGAAVVWLQNKHGKYLPMQRSPERVCVRVHEKGGNELDPEGLSMVAVDVFTNHYETCPKPDRIWP